MPRPEVTPATESLYRLLPDYARAVDESNAFTLLAFAAAIATGHDPARAFLDTADPDTSVSGTCEPADPAAAQRRLLPWLGWLVGVDTSALDDADVREAIATAATSQRRGTRLGIITAVTRTLSTPTPAPRVYSGSVLHPYRIAVIVTPAQCPDEPAALAAALTEKPAGAVLDLHLIDGVVIADLAAAFPTITALMTALPDAIDVATWTP
jgi:hypothetical protein